MVTAVLVAGVIVIGSGVQAVAQLFPQQGSDPTPTSDTTTTTTTDPVAEVLSPSEPAQPTQSQPPPESTTTTPPPATEQPAPAPSEPADPADPGPEGASPSGRVIPTDAQAIMNSIARTGPGDNGALVDGAALLESAGVPHDDAVRAVFGRFPILGPAHWSDDWYMPRWTGTQFRFHEGLDMFAAYGTPVAAPVDGIARIRTNSLGGLTVKIVEPDGTFWYLAHLSGVPEGLADGQAVTTGQVVGFVGNSGNAVGTPPHLHFGVYPNGGRAVPPKPIVDSWVADGAARVPELLAQARSIVATSGSAPVGTALRVSTAAIGAPAAVSPSRTELLWVSAANPAGGALHVADAAAAAAAERLDWNQRAAEQRAMDLAWDEARSRASRLLGPLTHPALRIAVEQLRSATASSSASSPGSS